MRVTQLTGKQRKFLDQAMWNMVCDVGVYNVLDSISRVHKNRGAGDKRHQGLAWVVRAAAQMVRRELYERSYRKMPAFAKVIVREGTDARMAQAEEIYTRAKAEA